VLVDCAGPASPLCGGETGACRRGPGVGVEKAAGTSLSFSSGVLLWLWRGVDRNAGGSGGGVGIDDDMNDKSGTVG